MEFPDWLLAKKLLTVKQFSRLCLDQFQGGGIGIVDPKGDHHYETDLHLDALPLKTTFAKSPFGDELKKHPDLLSEVCRLAGVNDFEELVWAWYEWSVAKEQPIAHHNTDTEIGKTLYTHEQEKRLVAEFVCGGKNFNNRRFIYKTDRIVLPEGSASFYVGLSLAALQSGANVITSNQPLIQEFYINPVFAGAFGKFHVIGGQADGPGFVQGGVVGRVANTQYRRAIQTDPRLNVVIMPVSGLLPDEGPCALQERTSNLKKRILKACEGTERSKHGESINGVREVIFVCDASKHVKEAEDYGGPLFSIAEWEAWLDRNKDRASLVTTPSTNLRRAILDRKVSADISTRSLEGVPASYGLSNEDDDYVFRAKQLQKKFGNRMYEVLDHLPITAGQPLGRKSATHTPKMVTVPTTGGGSKPPEQEGPRRPK